MRENRTERKGGKVDKRVANEWMKKAPKPCGVSGVLHCRAVFLAKLNETFQTAPKTRKDKIFGQFSLIIGSEIWYMLTVGIVLVTDSVDWLCWLIDQSVCIASSCANLWSRLSQEKQFILLNIFMKLRNKITEDINERYKPYVMLYGLNGVLKCVIKKNVPQRRVRKVEN